jgi:chromosome segregation ATPase
MLKQNHAKIVQLTEDHNHVVTQLQHKDSLLQEFEKKFRSLKEDVIQHEVDRQAKHAQEGGIEKEFAHKNDNTGTLDGISKRLKAITKNLSQRMNYIQKGEFYIKTSVIKKAIAMVKAKQEIEHSKSLMKQLKQNEVEIKALKEQIGKVWIII